MKNFKLVIEYDGTKFNGWQTQSPGHRTVQSHIEEKLEYIFKEKVHCHASGRTDSGAHAFAQVAHVRVVTHMETALVKKALNSFLDPDVRIIDVIEEISSFHAQKSVIEKTYRYMILNRSSPSAIWYRRAYFYPDPLDVEQMIKAAKIFIGTHDFKAVQSLSSRTPLRTSVRTISHFNVQKDGDFIYCTVTADGFLYRMVRNMVAILIEAGAGRMSLDEVRMLLKSKEQKNCPLALPSWGLYLMSVKY